MSTVSTVSTAPHIDSGTNVADAKKLLSPHEVRHMLNDIEAWFRKNRDRLEADDQILCEALLETAFTQTHLESLQGWLREKIDG